MQHRTTCPIVFAIVFIVCASSASPSLAEYDPSEKRRTSVQLGFGVAGLLHEEMNKELKAAGFTELENPYVPFGLSMLNYNGRFAYGFGLNLLLHVRDPIEREDYRGKLFAMAVAIHLGYEVVALESFSVIPLIGVGMSDATLSFYTKDNQRFDEVLEQQSGGVMVEGIGLLLDFALRLEYRVAINEDEGHRFDLALGLVGGFHYTPAVFSWMQSSFGELDDGPDFGVTGPYGLFTFGIATSNFPVDR